MKKNYPTHIITHHSNGGVANRCYSTKHHDVFTIDGAHMKRWKGFTSQKLRRQDSGDFWHVGYHFVTDLTRRVTFKTRELNEEGAHCIGKNTSSLGWLIIGNYTDCSVDEITPEDKIFLVEEMKKYIVPAMKEFNIPIENMRPHRDWTNKDCHGSKLSDTFYADLLKEKQGVGDEELQDLKVKVEKLEELVQSVQRLIVLLINMIVKQRLALRENNQNT